MRLALTRYAAFIVRNRIIVLVGTLLVSALLASQLRHIQLQIHRRDQLPDYHPYVQIQNRSADLFGGDTTIIVGIFARHGDIFTTPLLSKIMRLTAAIQQLPGVIPENVLSIASPEVKSIKSSPDGLAIHQLMSTIPKSPDELRRLKAYVLNDSIYLNTLVSADGSAAAIIADFDDSVTDAAICSAIDHILSVERDDSSDFALAGAPLVRYSVQRYAAMMRFLFPLAVLIIGAVHYEAFRTVQALVLPLATALLSVVWSLGIVGFFRQTLDTWTAITPIVILAIAAGHAVQVLKRYYEEYALDGDSHAAVIRSLGAVGPVMITACAIAASGFASLATFRVASVRAFGLLLALGIVSALVIEMTFTPACRALLPKPRGRELSRQHGGRFLTAALHRLATVVISAPRLTLLVALVVCGASLLGAWQVKVDNSFKGWFAAGDRIRRDDDALNERFGGTSTVRILIEGQRDGDITEPAVLAAVADLEDYLRRYEKIGAVTSVADYVSRMHLAMNPSGSQAARFPDSRRQIAQYLFLYSMSGPGALNSIVDGNYRFALLRAYAKTDEAEYGRDLFASVKQFVATRFGGLPVQVKVAGGALGVQTAMNEVIVREKIVNVAQVGIIIFVLAALALRSLVGGLIVLLPLMMAILVNLGVMGWTKTWLSIATATITSMAVSIGADFALYLIFRIREEISRTTSLDEALRAAVLTSGKAIFFVSSAVALGYLTLVASGFSIWINLGILTALMIVVSAIGSLTVIPAIAVLAKPSVFVGARQRDSQATMVP